MTDATTMDKTRPTPPEGDPERRAALVAAALRALGGRPLVLVGMMGAGKTSIGKRLAAALDLPFVDADVEIESAAGMTISEIFERHGEPYFRDGERRVIARLLGDKQAVVATGGGAWMNEATRRRVQERGVSLWLKAEVDVLLQRVRKRTNRPLMQVQDPEAALRRLVEDRYPVYATADYQVVSRDGPHQVMVDLVLETLARGAEEESASEPARASDAARPPSTRQAAGPILVPVELGARRYEIKIGAGLLADAGAEIARLAPGAACAIVTDTNVARHCLPALEASLRAANIRFSTVIIEAGEASKSWSVFARVCDDIIAARIERGDLIVALGGGVVGDLAGFAAATIRRGMRFAQIPTTVLAQVDSSVGGKTAINSDHGKNLIGAFHQPSLVLIDTLSLASLPEREFRAGYGEIVKYGLIDDAPFFEWLEQNWRGVFSRGPELTRAIAVSCRSKAAIVARDETEQGDRMLLNLGHTFGHALETLLHYDSKRLVHGEGVAIGLACAHRFSARLGHCSIDDGRRVEAHLRDVGLPSRISDLAGWNAGAADVLDAMYQDKKVRGGALTFILTRGIGKSFIARGVSAEAVEAFLREELGR